MEFNPLAFFEFFVIFAFAIGWAILELVGLRLDKRRKAEAEKAKIEETKSPKVENGPQSTSL